MAAPVHVLDNFYLAITLLVTVGYQMLGFAIAWTLQVPARIVYTSHTLADAAKV